MKKKKKVERITRRMPVKEKKGPGRPNIPQNESVAKSFVYIRHFFFLELFERHALVDPLQKKFFDGA